MKNEMKKNAKALEILRAVVSDVTMTDSRSGETVTRGKQHKLVAADFDNKAEFDGYKRAMLDLSESVRKYANANADDAKAHAAARADAKKALKHAADVVTTMTDGNALVVPAAMLEYIVQRTTTAKAIAGEKSMQRVMCSPVTFRGVFEDAFCKLLNGEPFANVGQNASAAKDFANNAKADARAAEKAKKDAEKAARAAEKAADNAAAERAHVKNVHDGKTAGKGKKSDEPAVAVTAA